MYWGFLKSLIMSCMYTHVHAFRACVCVLYVVSCGNACTRVCLFLCRHGPWQECMSVESLKEHNKHGLCSRGPHSVYGKSQLCENADLTSVLRSHLLRASS